jgi:hypothetical protein
VAVWQQGLLPKHTSLVTLWSTLQPFQLLPSCLSSPSQFAPNTLKHKQKPAVPAGALLSSLNVGQFRNMMVQGCTSSTFNDNIPNHTTIAHVYTITISRQLHVFNPHCLVHRRLPDFCLPHRCRLRHCMTSSSSTPAKFWWPNLTPTGTHFLL